MAAMRIPFSKYSGCGNDFILIDNREKIFDVESPDEIANLCHRRYGIGADGLILLEKSATANFRMRIFNADGSEAEMCGNGIRCLAKFICELGIAENCFLIETMHQQIEVVVSCDMVSVKMPIPTEINFHAKISVDGQPLVIHHLDTGVPHAVLFVEDLEDESLMERAPLVRFHPHFTKGTNVNYAAVTADGTVAVRTYERGVEGETLACGTGAAAVAIAAAYVYNLLSPITIYPRSKDILQIAFTGPGHSPENLVMTGPAIKIFTGSFLKHTK